MRFVSHSIQAVFCHSKILIDYFKAANTVLFHTTLMSKKRNLQLLHFSCNYPQRSAYKSYVYWIFEPFFEASLLCFWEVRKHLQTMNYWYNFCSICLNFGKENFSRGRKPKQYLICLVCCFAFDVLFQMAIICRTCSFPMLTFAVSIILFARHGF